MKSRLWVTIFVSCLISSCGDRGQNDSLNESFEELIENVTLEADDSSDYEVEIITEKGKVELLKRRIHESQESQARFENTEAAPNSLAGRYKAGDKSVVPDIVSLLKGRMNDEKTNLYFDLSPAWDDSTKLITEPEINQAVFENIKRGGEEEERAIQFAGILDMKGSQKVFEERLLSGKSLYEHRLFYWISEKAKSERALDYVIGQIESGEIDESELGNGYMDGILSYCENGTKSMREKALSVSYYVRDNNLIDSERFRETRDGFSSTNPVFPLLRILYEYGDERSIVDAKNDYGSDIMQELALACLIRLEGIEHEKKVYDLLNLVEKYRSGLNAVPAMYEVTKDDVLLAHVVKKYGEFFADDSDADFRREMVNTLLICNPENTLVILGENTNNIELLDKLKHDYYLLTADAVDIADELYALGLIKNPIGSEQLSNMEYQTGREAYWELLTMSDIYTHFFAEGGFPLQYDWLVEEFCSNSRGILDEANVGMEAHELDDEVFAYEVMVVFNEVGFVIKPADNGYRFNTDHVLELLNTILEYNNYSQRFVALLQDVDYLEYLFGEPEAVEAFKEKYQ